MMKTIAVSKSEVKNTGYTRDLLVNSCQGMVAEIILRLNWLNASICSGIGCDKRS